MDVDDDIDPGLLDHIPDVVVPSLSLEMEAPATPEPFPSRELQTLLGHLQTEMQAVLADECTRVEATVALRFSGLQARLAEAHALVEQLSKENAQILHSKERYERAFLALKELTRDVEEAA